MVSDDISTRMELSFKDLNIVLIPAATVSHPSIAAARVVGLAYRILLQNLKGFDENKKMSQFLK